MDKRMKVIIDTDIGDDIDDAFALLYAMKLGFDIIGITTVFRNTLQRAKMTKKLLSDYGCGYESVKVYAGCGTPLASEDMEYPTLPCYTPEAEEYEPDGTDENEAIDFLIESARKYGKDLTVIALGPFTNMAKAAMRDPDAMNSVSRTVIMGGAFYKQYADWNVACDPEAAKIFFESVKNIHAMGADVTHKLMITEKDDALIEGYSKDNKAATYAKEMYKLWKRDSGKKLGVLHDPLAIYYAFDSSVTLMERACVEVITDGPARAMTLNVDAYSKSWMNPYYKEKSPTLTVAKEVNRELIISDFMECFK